MVIQCPLPISSQINCIKSCYYFHSKRYYIYRLDLLVIGTCYVLDQKKIQTPSDANDIWGTIRRYLYTI